MARAGRPRRATRKITLALDVDALDLLEQLAPVNKRSRYVSELLRREGVAAGVIAPDEKRPAPPDLATLQQHVSAVAAGAQELQRWIDAALAARQAL